MRRSPSLLLYARYISEDAGNEDRHTDEMCVEMQVQCLCACVNVDLRNQVRYTSICLCIHESPAAYGLNPHSRRVPSRRPLVHASAPETHFTRRDRPCISYTHMHIDGQISLHIPVSSARADMLCAPNACLMVVSESKIVLLEV